MELITQGDALASAPRTLQELLDGRASGYQPKIAYYIELVHSLMPQYPALYKGTRHVVLATDLDVIADVWKSLLPSRRAKLGKMHYYVNEAGNVGFPVLDDYSRSKPLRILSREVLKELFAVDQQPFEWAPGLLSLSDDSMSVAEFEYLLKVERDSMKPIAEPA